MKRIKYDENGVLIIRAKRERHYSKGGKVTERRKRVLDRLQERLSSGMDIEGKPLLATAVNRINSEIETLKECIKTY